MNCGPVSHKYQHGSSSTKDHKQWLSLLFHMIQSLSLLSSPIPVNLHCNLSSAAFRLTFCSHSHFLFTLLYFLSSSSVQFVDFPFTCALTLWTREVLFVLPWCFTRESQTWIDLTYISTVVLSCLFCVRSPHALSLYHRLFFTLLYLWRIFYTNYPSTYILFLFFFRESSRSMLDHFSNKWRIPSNLSILSFSSNFHRINIESYWNSREFKLFLLLIFYDNIQMSASPPPSATRNVAVLVLALVIDMLAFTCILPLFPSIISFYSKTPHRVWRLFAYLYAFFLLFHQTNCAKNNPMSNFRSHM